MIWLEREAGGRGRGQPSATKVLALEVEGEDGGRGRGQPSATKVLALEVEGECGGSGRGQPSATKVLALAGLLTLYLPFLVPGSRIKAAKSKTADMITSFFMDEPSWLSTMRVSRGRRDQSLKMF